MHIYITGVVMALVIVDLKRFPRVTPSTKSETGLKVQKPPRKIKSSMELATQSTLVM